MMGAMPLSRCPLSVWWELSTCPLPVEMDPSLLPFEMQSAFVGHGLSPAIDTFSAYADASYLPFSRQKALVDAGIRLHHTPQGQTNIKGFAMVVDMLIWVLEHPAPANIVVITSNTELANPLHKLRMKCYNIILITPELDLKSSFSLTNAATLVLTWPSLHILPEAMQYQVLSCKSYSTPFVNDSSMTKIDNNSNSDASRKRPPDQDTTEPVDMKNLKKRRICDDDSLKRPDLDSLCMPPLSNASQEEKEEEQGVISEELLEFKKAEAWLQSLMKSKGAANGIPISRLPDMFMHEAGAKHTLQEVLGNKKLRAGLLKFQHIIDFKHRGKGISAFPIISQKPDMDIQEASQAQMVEEGGTTTTHISVTEPSETGSFKNINDSLKQLSDNTPKRSSQRECYTKGLYAFPVIPQKDDMVMQVAIQAEKVNEEGTTHIPLIEPSESGKVEKKRIVEYLEHRAGHSPKRAALDSPYMPRPPDANQKKKAEQQGTNESLVLAKFEPWLQNLMQTKKTAKGILISCLEDMFEQESGITRKLKKLLGKETLSAGLLRFPHIIRLEQHGSEVFAFPVIPQKDDMIMQEGTQTEKGKITQEATQTVKGKIMQGPTQTVKGKEVGITNITLIEPSKTGKAKIAALGSPYMSPSPTNSSPKKRVEKQRTKESLILAKFEPWLNDLMQTKKVAKGIPISCLEELFKQESGMTQKLRNHLGGGRLTAILRKFPRILRLKRYGPEIYAFPVISQKFDTKESQAEKIKEEGTTHIPLIDPSESGNTEKVRMAESLKQLAGNSPQRAGLGSPYMSCPPSNASQKKKAKQQGTKVSIH